MDSALDAVVVGAGPAGLAVAGCLRVRGASFEIFDRSHRLAESWHNHYESLRLHTDKRNSELPGMAFPKGYPRYVPRDTGGPFFGASAGRCILLLQ